MEKTQNKIGQDFTVLGLAWFALPAFFTNFFAQLFQSLDDGLFISRYVGETALAGFNLLNPLAGIQMGIEHLFSLGSSNISAKLMGEGKQREAKEVFSRVCVVGFIFSSIFALLVNIFSSQILTFLGADDELAHYAIYQIRIVYSLLPFSIMNRAFGCYYSTAGKPKMGMYCSIINGTFNIGLDIILVAILKMGVLGACIATAAGNLAVFIVGLIFFSNKNNEIHFVNPHGDYISTTLQSVKYALPQCINALSFSITSYLTNMTILKMVGSTGVAVNAVVGDVRSILTSGLVGFAICVGPIVSFNVGSKDTVKLKRILTHILKIWVIGSAILTVIGLLLRKPLLSMFMHDSTQADFYNMAFLALTIEMFGIPACSGAIISGRMFIALGNSKVAIFASVMRNLVIRAIMLALLPSLFDSTGIWMAVPASEYLSLFMCAFLLAKNADNYGYGKTGVAYYINK